jgi:hypothetical protein
MANQMIATAQPATTQRATGSAQRLEIVRPNPMTARMTAATVSSEMQTRVVSAAIKSNLSNITLILPGLRSGDFFAFG